MENNYQDIGAASVRCANSGSISNIHSFTQKALREQAEKMLKIKEKADKVQKEANLYKDQRPEDDDTKHTVVVD